MTRADSIIGQNLGENEKGEILKQKDPMSTKKAKARMEATYDAEIQE